MRRTYDESKPASGQGSIVRFRQIGVTMPLENKTELFWQAFRYVGDEMTPAEASEFEAELADQQTAREAVARVVELSQLVLAAAPEESPIEIFVTPVRNSQAWMQPVGWIAVGAAACLAMVMAYQSFLPATGATEMASTSPAAVSDLALVGLVQMPARMLLRRLLPPRSGQ